MANMSYCRFQNTVTDLQDCLEHIDDAIDDEEEHNARQNLIRVCLAIVEDGGYWIGIKFEDSQQGED